MKKSGKKLRIFFTVLIIIGLIGNFQVTSASPILYKDDWEKEVENMLNEFLSCTEPLDDISPCNIFLAKALKKVYSINDFDRPNKPGSFLTANEISNYVEKNSDKWTLLGNASSQSVLNEAQGYANRKKAIIAVLKGNPHGHVAMVLPGEQTFSGNWQLKVPNSASFFLNKPKKSYVGKGLSFAFSKPDGVKIYGRNF